MNILNFHQNCSSTVFIFRLVLNLEDNFFFRQKLYMFYAAILIKFKEKLCAWWSSRSLKKIYFGFIVEKIFYSKEIFLREMFLCSKKCFGQNCFLLETNIFAIITFIFKNCFAQNKKILLCKIEFCSIINFLQDK